MDIYGHLTQGMQDKAAKVMDEITGYMKIPIVVSNLNIKV